MIMGERIEVTLVSAEEPGVVELIVSAHHHAGASETKRVRLQEGESFEIKPELCVEEPE